MLPNISPRFFGKSAIIGAVTAFSLAITSAAPAHALGKNEQKFLQGAAAALIVNEIIKDARSRRAAPAPVYVQPQYVQPRRVYTQPTYRAANLRAADVSAAGSLSINQHLSHSGGPGFQQL